MNSPSTSQLKNNHANTLETEYWLRCRNLSKNFGGNHAVKNINLKLKKEKINAIVGPNGSGKSTFFNLISKVYQPSAGEIFIASENVTGLSDFILASPKRSNNISRTFQETPLFPYLTVRQHLQLALNTEDESLLAVFKKHSYQGNFSDEHLKGILKNVALDISLDSIPSMLSYGQKKLLTFALATAKPHKVLLIDEPVSGVNPKIREIIANLLLRMKQQKETIILIEHDMNFIFSIADHVAVMDAGELIFEGTPKEVRGNKAVLEAYMGA